MAALLLDQTMPIARTEYARDLVEDALLVTNDPHIVSAIVLNDALNGVRRAVLDLAETNRLIAEELGSIADAARSA